jgi:hypothetical protein
MRLNNTHSYTDDIFDGIPLQSLVNRLLGLSSKHNSYLSSFISNEVPYDFMVIGDENKLSPVIKDLLTVIVMNARNGDIHITAEKFNDMATIQIEDRNSYNTYAVASRLQSIEPDARKLGGHIDLKGKNKLISTVSFSFPSYPQLVH